MSADFESRFLDGIAARLGTSGAATWRPDDSAYAAGETGIVLGGLPQSPDRVVALDTYNIDDDPSMSDSVLGLQVKTRWGGQDRRPVLDLAGGIYDALHGLHDVDLTTGVRLVQCLIRSHTSIGQDDNARWRRVQNFYCTVHRPSPHRQ